MPVGAFGGKREIMDMLAPQGPVYQAGTLSGNPMAMSCGLSLLNELNDNPEIYRSLENKSAFLENGFRNVFKQYDLEYTLNRVGSMMSFHLGVSKVTDFKDASSANSALFNQIFHGMLKGGIYFAPSAFESLFVATTHELDLLERTISTLDETLNDLLS
jgi:glutamate-1-semialdehyde 2,1-aminomutase